MLSIVIERRNDNFRKKDNIFSSNRVVWNILSVLYKENTEYFVRYFSEVQHITALQIYY
jgi:hypothetical protein